MSSKEIKAKIQLLTGCTAALLISFFSGFFNNKKREFDKITTSYYTTDSLTA
jgi:hypothetical protein